MHAVRAPEELDETGNKHSSNDTLDRWILLLGEQLAELGCGIELTVKVVAHGIVDHPWEFIGELSIDSSGGSVIVI